MLPRTTVTAPRFLEQCPLCSSLAKVPAEANTRLALYWIGSVTRTIEMRMAPCRRSPKAKLWLIPASHEDADPHIVPCRPKSALLELLAHAHVKRSSRVDLPRLHRAGNLSETPSRPLPAPVSMPETDTFQKFVQHWATNARCSPTYEACLAHNRPSCARATPLNLSRQRRNVLRVPNGQRGMVL